MHEVTLRTERPLGFHPNGLTVLALTPLGGSLEHSRNDLLRVDQMAHEPVSVLGELDVLSSSRTLLDHPEPERAHVPVGALSLEEDRVALRTHEAEVCIELIVSGDRFGCHKVDVLGELPEVALELRGLALKVDSRADHPEPSG